MELTKKQLKELATSLDAYYLGGNVYDYENIVYYLDYKLDSQSLEKYNKPDLLKLLKDIDTNYNLNNFINGSVYKISATQVAYCHGVYGNSGQLHQLKIYNIETNEHIFSYYVYYC